MSVFINTIATLDHAAQGTAGTDETTEVGECQYDATVTEVSFIPSVALTADDTNNRVFTLQNKGSAGSGTTAIATLTTNLASGNWVANDERVMTLSATPANLNVSKDDVLAIVETHGGSGVAHPSMKFTVKGTRR